MRFAIGLQTLLCAACVASTPLEGAPDERDLRDEVIYQIVVDRFDNGDVSNDDADGVATEPEDLARFQGGDWAGITRRLDYLEDLGATTLWISPIVANVERREDADGYHGYWARDFTKLNAHFGSEAELKELVAEAHARGMRILVDVVINHAGNVFYYDLNDDGKLQSGENEPSFSAEPYDVPIGYRNDPVRLWHRSSNDTIETRALDESAYHRQGQTTLFNDPEQMERGDFPTGLRDLSTDDPMVMDDLITTYAEWVRRTDVDGFRLDAVPHVPREDWKRFCTGLRARLAELDKSEFFLLGEVFRTQPAQLASYTQPGMLDSAFDFTFKSDAIDHYLLEGQAPSVARFALESARAAYPTSAQDLGVGLDPWQARVTFLDNHDVPRIRGRLEDERAVWLSLTLLFTADGIPAIYYGTEQGLAGGFGHSARERLWDTGFDQTHPTYQLITRLNTLRREHRVLRRGDLTIRYASQNDGFSKAKDAGILAFERSDGEARLLVLLNGHATKTSTARIDTGFGAGTRLHDLLGAPTVIDVGEDGRIEVNLAARSALILERTR